MSTGFTCRHLAVVGLGLMGGSLARALRPYAGTISGVEMNPQAREFAVANGVVDTATDDLRAGVSDADVVILAAPVRVIIDVLNNSIGSYLRSNTLLIDIGSTKRDICDAMGKLPIGIQAIGGHPMTGKESNGVQESEATLFEGRPFVLCASRRTTPATRDRAMALIAAINAVPIEMEPQRHDHVVAAISHLPYLISSALVATVAQQGEEDDAVWRLAAGGFRDTSRLAAQDLNMMGDILSTNTQAVATLLAIFRMKLAMIEASLIAQENGKLVDLLRPPRDARIAWQKQQDAKK